MSAVASETALHLRWLVRLRWGAVLAHLGMVVLLRWLLGEDTALGFAALLLAVNAASNVALGLWLARGAREVAAWVLPAVLLADVTTLTGLLFFTGGPMNPFTALYVVHVALAAVVCARRAAWTVALGAIAGYGLLFVTGGDLAHHNHARMVLHLRGMWIAFSVAAAFVTFFVSRARQALAEREVAEQRLRAAEERQTRLAALATLAGGAAHELATPLSTIAVAAGELAHRLDDASDGARSDTTLILAEVKRCKHILEQLSVQAGEALGEAPVLAPLIEVVQSALQGVVGGEAVVVRSDPAAVARVPARAVATALRGLIHNARQASEAVTVVIEAHPPRIVVEDHGQGIAPELLARIGEPFFTTRAPGRGMGLGVFLARTLAERLGGTLVHTSEVGRGTRAVWTFAEDVGR
ncbi:MAG: HAMP domain-containing histidine kinase [Deltaproteobacteria bacterium]|nr:HAMP domain-containing histidine kinase [Deltaproteobacteria bacterium]